GGRELTAIVEDLDRHRPDAELFLPDVNSSATVPRPVNSSGHFSPAQTSVPEQRRQENEADRAPRQRRQARGLDRSVDLEHARQMRVFELLPDRRRERRETQAAAVAARARMAADQGPDA